jgi:hypothetical protein
VRLTIITPSLNSGACVVQTVESVAAAIALARSRHPELQVEQIIFDDGSEDEATLAAYREIGTRFAFCRIEAEGPSRQGPAAARKRAIARAGGEWIGFIDADDLVEPAGLAALIDVALREPGANWVVGDACAFYPDGREEAKPSYCRRLLGEGQVDRILVPPEVLLRLLAGPPNLFLGAMIARRSLIEAAGGFDPSLLCGEDWSLTLKMATLSGAWYTPVRVERFRRGHGSLTQSPRAMGVPAFLATLRALRDPGFKRVRKILRWTLITQIANVRDRQLAAGNRLKAFRFGFLAWCAGPERPALLARALACLFAPQPPRP